MEGFTHEWASLLVQGRCELFHNSYYNDVDDSDSNDSNNEDDDNESGDDIEITIQQTF